MSILQRHRCGLITGWGIVRVFGVCVLIAPVWLVLASYSLFMPAGWDEGPSFSFFALPAVMGSLTVGAAFLLLAKLERGIPHFGFGVLVPAIGVVTFSVLRIPTMGNHGTFSAIEGFGSMYVIGLVWFYVINGLIAIPLGLAHAALMIRVSRMDLGEVPPA